MELFDAIRQRFLVRKFKRQPVEKQKLLQILDAGRIAPSAVNYQPWHFIVVDHEIRVRPYSIYPAKWLCLFRSFTIVEMGN